MSSTFEKVLEGTRFLTEAWNVYEEVEKTVGRGGPVTQVAFANAYMKASNLVLAPMRAWYADPSNKAGLEKERKIVNYEAFARTGQTVLSTFKEIVDVADRNEPDMKFFEGRVADLASLLRTLHEMSRLQEDIYLHLDPEEFAATERDILELNDNNRLVPVGKKPLDADECRQNMESLTTGRNVLSVIEIITRLKLVSRAVEWIRGPQPDVAPVALHQLLAQGVPDNVIKAFDFRSHPTVPSEFAADPVLRAYICPITQQPIRHIVRDPQGDDSDDGHYYEKAAILDWLARNPRSPVGEWELTAEMLKECPDEQAIIDERLDKLSERVRGALDQIMKAEEKVGDVGQEVAAPAVIIEALENAEEEPVIVDLPNE